MSTNLARHTQEDVLADVAEALGLMAAQLKPTSRAEHFEQWDSMGTLAIMAMLDEKYGLALQPGQAAGLQNVAGIFTLLREGGQLS